jgi:hypothetical protein
VKFMTRMRTGGLRPYELLPDGSRTDKLPIERRDHRAADLVALWRAGHGHDAQVIQAWLEQRGVGVRAVVAKRVRRAASRRIAGALQHTVR